MRSADDGLTWNIVFTAAVNFQSIAATDGYFMAVCDNGAVYTSSDAGLSWLPQTTLSGQYYESITGYNGKFYVSDSDKLATSTAWTGDNGATWNYEDTPTGAYWNNLSTDGTNLVCVGNIGAMSHVI